MIRTDDLARADPHPPVVDTPLGQVRFSISLAEVDLAVTPDAVWRLANGSYLYRWQHRRSTIDLLLGRVEIPAWDGGAAVPMWAAIWQVQAGEGRPGLVIAAELTDIPADAFGGPDPGECLAAASAENDRFMVAIGGPDAELLALQAEDGRLMPADWADLLAEGADGGYAEYGVRYRDPVGIAWHLPGLAREEVARLCVATAWCPRDDDRPAAWYAVDVPLDTAYLQLIAQPTGPTEMF
ncbi:hypothetical protein ACWEVD_22950 [Nocardia thailandica]|uniref:Uncharacterized protein n=1 Tax=Nocardia thailandica TaxID=257275 RepID=A0ABW6PR21_9NOCA|nr:hypothetical protein [Nocardia thailandica]